MSRRRHNSHQRRKLKRQGLILAALLVAIIPVVALLHYIDNRQTVNTGASSDLDTVRINGILCTPKQNLKTYLVMGIDDTAEKGENYVTGGMCDVLQLLVIDQVQDTYARLPINRNTVTEVRSYDEKGNDLGTSDAQIAFAHSQGDGGGTLSCENTVEAVSNYLGGQEIDGYAALNMKAVPILNRMVGGVTVTIKDDFSKSDPSLKKGKTVRLNDKQALRFVRGRLAVGDGTNESRMRRQEQYIDGFRAAATKKMKKNSAFANELYDALLNQMVTDLTGKDCSRIANALLNCQSQGAVDIEGTIGEDDLGFVTFEPDKDSLAQARITLFYDRVVE